MYVHPDVPVNLSRTGCNLVVCQYFEEREDWFTGACRISAGCMGKPRKRWLKKGLCVMAATITPDKPRTSWLM